MLVDHPRLEEKLILSALKESGVPVKVVNTLTDPLSLKEGQGIALIRTVSMYRAVRSAAFLEASGFHAINSSLTLQICGDKALTYASLSSAGVRILPTLLALGADAAIKAFRLIGGKVVDKPPIGSWGRLISLVKNERSMSSLASVREALPSNVKGHLIQRYVETGGRDIRCLVLGDELIGCVQRYASNGWKSNVALGAFTKQISPDEELKELSLRASEAVSGEFVAIDLLSDGETYVNEVNGVPEFKGFMKATGIPVHELLAQYVRGVVRA